MFKPGFFTANPSHAQLTWAAILVLGVLVLAFFLETWRRRRERRRHLQAEWRAVREIAKEKDLSKEAQGVLESLLRKYAADGPLRAITTRQQFDACVLREIRDIAARNDVARLEKQGILLREIRVHLGLDYIPYGQRIHSTRELYQGQVLWIADREAASPEWARMTVAAVDEAFFRITPNTSARLPAVSPGKAVRCRMWREDDARYTFSASLVRVEPDPTTWVFLHAEELNRTQSRAHFRIHYDRNVSITILNAPVDGDLSDVDQRPAVTRLQGRMVSLSGGGFAAVLPQAIPKQILLRLSLELDPNAPAPTVTAQPVNVTALSPGRHLVRAAFVAISDETRDLITHFVFQQQQPQKTADSPAAKDSE